MYALKIKKLTINFPYRKNFVTILDKNKNAQYVKNKKNATFNN